jgi:hypothetical protein
MPILIERHDRRALRPGGMKLPAVAIRSPTPAILTELRDRERQRVRQQPGYPCRSPPLLGRQPDPIEPYPLTLS